MRLYFNRIFRAATLDVSLYQEVVAEPLLLNQAWITVLLYAMLAAWGSFGRAGAVGSNIGMIGALIGWYIWAFSSYFIATRFFRGGSAESQRANRKAVIRAMGFACAPGVTRLLGMIPGLGIAVLVLSSIWMIVAATVAIKVALNFESAAHAAIAQGLLLVLLFSVFGVS
ncbi:MAG: YIP1 family protein [Desulfobacterales bacterium]|jgi:hypothetical protein